VVLAPSRRPTAEEGPRQKVEDRGGVDPSAFLQFDLNLSRYMCPTCYTHVSNSFFFISLFGFLLQSRLLECAMESSFSSPCDPEMFPSLLTFDSDTTCYSTQQNPARTIVLTSRRSTKPMYIEAHNKKTLCLAQSKRLA
jgi:hypothetical protein